MARPLKPYERVLILLRKTKSGEIEWVNKDNGLYMSVVDKIHIYIYHFQKEVRGCPQLVLELKEGSTKQTIKEPDLHISVVPFRKIQYWAVCVWNMLFSGIMPIRVPSLAFETEEEVENEQLRLNLQKLYTTITGTI